MRVSAARAFSPFPSRSLFSRPPSLSLSRFLGAGDNECESCCAWWDGSRSSAETQCQVYVDMAMVGDAKVVLFVFSFSFFPSTGERITTLTLLLCSSSWKMLDREGFRGGGGGALRGLLRRMGDRLLKGYDSLF